ncbi:MAG: cell division protein FtsH [Planctomycetaceae bacterium]|nr:cell division protein FtsH [Planctomycetaceae bacterium]
MLALSGGWNEPREITYSQLLNEIEAGNVRGVKFRGEQIVEGEFYRVPAPPGPSTSAETDDETSPPADDAGDEDASDESDEDDADGGQQPADSPSDQPQQSKSGQSSKADKDALKFQCELPPLVGEQFLAALRAHDVAIVSEEPANFGDLLALAMFVLLAVLMIGAWGMMRRTREQMMGGGMLTGVTKSPAKRYDASSNRITFDDVAGLGGVKSDLKELVDFLKAPEKFQRLGALPPKGVLLMGPPGTGKTLLARAVAGEAEVPFFSISGSEFIQLFVGVGAGRVRDMFKTAKENSPSILFIDEIDAVGRQRGAGLGGGHDEREQTLNQILSEMDGFTPSSTVIVVAATNRPDVLDPALLRPGRFDRHITVDRPTVAGRKALFELHAAKVPIDETVDFDRLARATVGLTGADIRNIVNEAALWATRNDKQHVGAEDFEYARDKVIMGGRREDILSDQEKLITAYHEAGHALLAWLLPGSDLVHKVTIIPRGRALGVTQLIPEADIQHITRKSLEARIIMGLGGRAAERKQFNECSTGAEQDLRMVTQIARRMVTRWGMSERLGPIALSNSEEHPFLGREIVQEERQFSEHTAQVIDEEVARILHACDQRAVDMLGEHGDKLDSLSNALLEREELDIDEITELIGPSVNKPRPIIDEASTGASS